jgi:hypothetical protein
MNMKRIEVNCASGETVEIELTAEEIAALPVPITPSYAQLRAAEYPPMTDYIDGVVKGDQTQMDAYVAACLAVKAKYPK